MKVEGMDVVVDQYVGRLSHQEAYELAYELLRRAKQAWPYYVQTGQPYCENKRLQDCLYTDKMVET
jgi:hypothetical protein